jgi:hypothetical protein
LIRSLDMTDRYWFEEARTLLGHQSFALVARGERARRIRHYLFTLEKGAQQRSFLRDAIASLRVGRRFRGLYHRGAVKSKAVGVTSPEADTIIVTFYCKSPWEL